MNLQVISMNLMSMIGVVVVAGLEVVVVVVMSISKSEKCIWMD